MNFFWHLENDVDVSVMRFMYDSTVAVTIKDFKDMSDICIFFPTEESFKDFKEKVGKLI